MLNIEVIDIENISIDCGNDGYTILYFDSLPINLTTSQLELLQSLVQDYLESQ